MITNRDDQWHKAIGRLIFSFGFIEMHLNQYLSIWLDVDVYEHIVGSKLADRLRLARSLAASNSSDPGFYDRVVKSLDDIKQLSEKRNIVAHNPVLMSSKRLPDDKWDTKSVIRHPRIKTRVLTLQDVEQIAMEVEAARHELTDIMCKAVENVMGGLHGIAGKPRMVGIGRLLGAEIEGVAFTPFEEAS